MINLLRRWRQKFDVFVLRLDPSDVIVLRTDVMVDAQEAEYLRRRWVEGTGLTNKVVVISGLSITVLAPESIRTYRGVHLNRCHQGVDDPGDPTIPERRG
jgi:hypothetical protein